MTTPLLFKTLSIRNFLSWGNHESVIELDGQGTVEVIGENMDRGNNSNGSGKCLCAETCINIRDARTGVVRSITIGELYALTVQQKRDSE